MNIACNIVHLTLNKTQLTFTSLSLVLLWQMFYLFCSSIVINTAIVTAETLSRNERGGVGGLAL
jgi:hypothetical protein